MNISPGIYAIHRGSDSEVQAQTLYDASTGLRLVVGPVASSAGSASPAVALVLRGEVEAQGLGTFTRGEAFVTGAATEIRTTSPSASLVIVTHENSSGLEKGVSVRSREHREWPECDPTPAAVLLSDTPSQTALTLYNDPSQAFGAGFWGTTAYSRRSIEFPKFELMYMLSGWIELTLDDGPTHRFEEGDTFLIAKGTHCDWRTGGMAKFCCTLVPVG